VHRSRLVVALALLAVPAAVGVDGAAAATTTTATATAPNQATTRVPNQQCTVAPSTAAAGYELETVASGFTDGPLAHAAVCAGALSGGFGAGGTLYIPDAYTRDVHSPRRPRRATPPAPAPAKRRSTR